jgi:hypothetical protein
VCLLSVYVRTTRTTTDVMWWNLVRDVVMCMYLCACYSGRDRGSFILISQFQVLSIKYSKAVWGLSANSDELNKTNSLYCY